MIGVDTNVLVRVVVDDDQAEDQCHKARMLLSSQKKIFVSQVVLIECVWVIQRAYSVGKNKTVSVLNALLSHPGVSLEGRLLVRKALQLYEENNVDFSDALIWTANSEKGSLLYTFDRKLARIEGMESL